MSAIVLACFLSLLIMFMHVQFDLGIERYTWSIKYIGIWVAWTASIYGGYVLWGFE